MNGPPAPAIVRLVLVEGIFLFKPQYRKYFDLTIWIDCSFPTALARAINRAQEGLSPANTIAVYETIYFPAQRIHLAQDKPRENAGLIFENDIYTPRHVLNRPGELSAHGELESTARAFSSKGFNLP